MEGIFPDNVRWKIVFRTSAQKAIDEIYLFLSENEKSLRKIEARQKSDKNSDGKVEIVGPEVTRSVDCRSLNIDRFLQVVIVGSLLLVKSCFDNISMLKRSYSMEFDIDLFKTQPSDSNQAAGSAASKDTDDALQTTKKMCNSSNFEDAKASADTEDSLENNRSSSLARPDSFRRYPQSGENGHVIQSRSIFSHEDSFVYGNPKEDIKNIENPPTGDVVGGASPFGANSSSVLDLSFKGTKTEDEKIQDQADGNTYHNYQRTGFGMDSPYPRSNIEIKLVNPMSKKPSIPEQLQIAKIQQQQRRSMQQQQKFLQQMRRSLDSKPSNRQDASQNNHKNVKYYGNSTTNHEQNDLDNHPRVKDEFHPPVPGSHFPQLPYPYFDPNHPKELPDNHPILPLLDPVYFSALYNAHGFLPPSSPSIAAAFIGTLQDALPKLPMMFPSTSSNNAPLLPQKNNENPN